jgi:acetyl/propionyl-CoA carboxylase alpha subunit
MANLHNVSKVLIANRGEIALRIMRSCHAMGLSTVAVYSQADSRAEFVRFADEAVCIGPASARESYLVSNRILDAARQTGAKAIHPGYGFLSENAEFAAAVTDNDLIFIGPSASIIRALGKKREAKIIAVAAGVPVVPGYNEAAQDDATLVAAALNVGFPLLIKASAGGGGKGMRIVHDIAELAPSLERARSEALAAFGDASLILERYIERPRHIEVQILGDKHGHLVHLWERECSIQRRHQKIVEESPAPGLSNDLRQAITSSAVKLGRAVGYDNAGTVEFIVDSQGKYYFLEVNTRLQVEHPVTEMTTGIDLVAEQLKIASGEPMTLREPPAHRGCAIEVRFCAEDPQRDNFPTTGTLHALTCANIPGVRYDLGVTAGSEVPVHYDSMLGKIIAFAETRLEAIAKLARAIDQLWSPGLTSNREYLRAIIGHPAFARGDLHTHFLTQHAGELAARPPGLDVIRVAATAATIALIEQRHQYQQIDAPTVAPGWRNVRFSDQKMKFQFDGADVEVGYSLPRFAPGVTLEIELGAKRMQIVQFGVHWQPPTGNSDSANHCEVWWQESGGLRRRSAVTLVGSQIWVGIDHRMYCLQLQERFPPKITKQDPGSLSAPMPGKVIRVSVAIGEQVKAGASLLVLEAMKMEHTLVAAADGTVTVLNIALGDQVLAGQLLAILS